MTVDEILVKIDGDMSGLRKDLDRIEKHTKAKTAAMGAAFKRVGIAIAGVASAAAMGAFVKSTIQVGSSVEGLRVQLKGLLGSAEEGEKAFAAMNEFASRVPFSLGQIQAASGSLAAASKNAEGMADMMQVTGNIAAQFNIPFEMAAENVQRALSAGAASADLFQQKGVNAMMGFQAGVSYSSEETARKLFEFFGKGGKFDGAMDEFALTTGGAVSMFDDALNKFQTKIAESGLNEGFSEFINQMTEIFNKSGGLAEALGSTLGSAFRALGDAVAFVDRVIGPVSEMFVAFGAVIGSVSNALANLFDPVTVALGDAFGATLKFAQENASFLSNVMASLLAFKIGAFFMRAAGGVFAYAKTMALAAAANIRFAFSFKTLRKAIPGLTAVLIALGEGLDEFAEKGRQGAKDLLPESLKKDFGIIGDTVDLFGQSVENVFNAIIGKATEFEDKLLETGGPSLDAALENSERIKQAMENLRGAGEGGLSRGGQSLVDDIANDNAKLIDQIKQLTVGSENFTDAQMRLADIKRNNKDLNAIEIAQLEELINRNEDLKVKLEQLELQKEGMEEFSKSLEGAMQQAGDAVSNQLANALVEGEFSLKSFRDIFKNFVKEMIAQAIKMFVIKSILNAIFGGPVGGGKVDLTGGTSGVMGMPNVMGSGGSMSPKSPYLVGERGPELVIPKTASTVLNSNNTRSVMREGGSPVVVNQNINVSTGVQDTVRAEVISLLPIIRQSTVEAVSSRVQRGGSYQKAIRG